MSVRASLAALVVVVGTVFVVGCAQTPSPTSPSSSAPTSLSSPSSPVRDASSGLAGSALSEGVTDETLANAGWPCRSPAPGLTICAPPGLGFPSIPPIPDNGGAPSYTLMAFVNHQFDHHVKFLRPDLYQGQPCQGDDRWHLFELVNYYECIIPVRGKK